jgi:hypothetical protein
MLEKSAGAHLQHHLRREPPSRRGLGRRCWRPWSWYARIRNPGLRSSTILNQHVESRFPSTRAIDAGQERHAALSRKPFCGHTDLHAVIFSAC